ncbi:hypothetical protein [Flavobacterium sp. YJ01]|uniref:hypothetical protein n=1 Tax=unclassified Flavobacterium TaxID=196869 RepID=UPI0023E4394E|nr:hypothetical protein [Flavobacterium sp. YJ01]WET01690.1 hypothetical protein P0R33_18200 [Flavobacterium sp. YJ01]
MAIAKQAKIIQIKVSDSYQLTVGRKLEKTANKLNYEATKDDLNLICGKKIIINGEKK